jgi:hypothetical protein
VFRLGDIVNHDIPQVWECLEQRGLRVGAVSPMNAKNRLRAPAFFVPDPWTATAIHASPTLKSLYGAIAQAVNDNATSRVSGRSLVNLLKGFLVYASPRNWPTYLAYAASAIGHPWRKAMFLDLFSRMSSRVNRAHTAALRDALQCRGPYPAPLSILLVGL